MWKAANEILHTTRAILVKNKLSQASPASLAQNKKEPIAALYSSSTYRLKQKSWKSLLHVGKTFDGFCEIFNFGLITLLHRVFNAVVDVPFQNDLSCFI